MNMAVRLMLNRAHQWETDNTWRSVRGLDLLPAPYPSSVMQFLVRTNEARVQAERKEAARQRAHHEEQAREAGREQLKRRPNVSRRALHERHERANRRIEERRDARRQNAGGEEGAAQATDTGGEPGAA